MRRPGAGIARRGSFRGIGGGSAALAVPQQVSGLVLWLRADLGITLNGSDVSDWADQSGNGNDATQVTASNQPVYNSTDANFNNQASISFNKASAEHLVCSDDDTLDLSASGMTMYVVCRVPSQAAGTRAIVDKYTNGGYTLYCTGANQTMNWLIRNSADTANFSVTDANIGDGAVRIIEARYSDTNDIIGVDPDGSESTAAATSHLANSVGLGFGARSGGAVPIDVDIAEVIMYQNGDLASADDTLIRDYLTARYGL